MVVAVATYGDRSEDGSWLIHVYDKSGREVDTLSYPHKENDSYIDGMNIHGALHDAGYVMSGPIQIEPSRMTIEVTQWSEENERLFW